MRVICFQLNDLLETVISLSEFKIIFPTKRVEVSNKLLLEKLYQFLLYLWKFDQKKHPAEEN